MAQAYILTAWGIILQRIVAALSGRIILMSILNPMRRRWRLGRADCMLPLIPIRPKDFGNRERACTGGRFLNKYNKNDVHEKIFII